MCFWEDDDVQFRDQDFAGGANTVSLHAARANYRATGASHADHLCHVRPPQPDEIEGEGSNPHAY